MIAPCAGPSCRPAPSPSSSRTSRARLGFSGSTARDTRICSTEHRRALRDAFSRSAASRSTPRATRSSSRSPGPPTRSRRPPSARQALERGPDRCAWESTPASRSSRTRATSGSTCIARRVSREPRTEGRSCLARRLAVSSTRTPVYVISASTGSRICRSRAPYQLGDGDFPPLKTLDATNLPVAASPLVGREHELGSWSRRFRTARAS